MRENVVRTTVSLPADLVDEADRAIRLGRARSRNELLVIALRHELAAQERASIDAAFASLADDHELQAESMQLAEEAVRSGWESLQEAEQA